MHVVTPFPFSSVESYPMPQVCGEQHDADGRRIAVTLESAKDSSATLDGPIWLVALDGSVNALHALQEAMRLATESGVFMLDLVNVQPWLSKEAAESDLPRRGWEAAVNACAILDSYQIKWRLHVLMGQPAKRIVELGEKLASRGTVIGARGLTLVETVLLGSVALQVIQTVRGAVLVVRAPPDQEA